MAFYIDWRVITYADEKAEITRLCTFETDSRTLQTRAAKATVLQDRRNRQPCALVDFLNYSA